MLTIDSSLAIWDSACNNIRWYLFKETLLCAVVRGQFPDELTYPQVVCFGEDLPVIIETVFPNLPNEWVLKKNDFGRGKHILLFLQEGKPVFELCVLCGVESLDKINDFAEKVNQIVSKYNKIEAFNSLGNRFQFYKKTLGKLFVSICSKLIDVNFSNIVSLAATNSKNRVFYNDCLTNENAVTLPESYFSDSLMINCGGINYPVFSGYREYLYNVFGDYKNGFVDDIGCGLTVEEKVELKQHQERCMDALSFLQYLSVEFGLRYYLLAGSVLGCKRHGGFIPWDDDIDIGIRLEELQKFEDVVKKQLPSHLPEGFSFIQSSANKPYPRMFSKICFNGRCCVDLWPLIPTYNEGFRSKFQWRLAKIIKTVHYVKIGHRVKRFRKIAKVISVFLTDEMVMKLARYNERIYSVFKTPSYINLYSVYSRQKETIQRSWLDDEVTAMFNGIEVPVVGCTDEYLTHLYGKYMIKPAPWKRVSRHTERFYIT